MRKFWVIVGQVYRKNVKSLGFITMIFSPLIMLAVIGGIAYFIGNKESEVPTIAVFSEMPGITGGIQTEAGHFTVKTAIASPDEALQAMAKGELDGYLEVEQEASALKASYTHLPDSQTMDMAYLTSLLSELQISLQAAEFDLSSAQVSALFTPPTVESNAVAIENGQVIQGDAVSQNIKTGAAYVISIAIFMFIMTYSSIIAEEIASEKGTRIMEVILSSVDSTTHFFGKLMGIFLICMTQIVTYLAVGVIAFQFDAVKKLMPMGIDLFETLQAILGISLYFFVIGIVLYAVIAAFLGSLVSKIEDVSKAVTPIVFIALTGFYGGMFAFVNTTHPLIKIGSHIPLFTPFIMPFRIAAETAAPAEVGVSMLVMLVFTVLITFVALNLYRSNVLIYSDAGMFKTIRTSFANIGNERNART